MSESMVVVCDVCGDLAEEGVILRVGGRNYAKDLCAKHLKELLSGTHAPKRGRRPGSRSKRGSATTPAPKATKRSSSRRAGATSGRRRRSKRTSAKRAA
jgi:hypothetical protein